MARRRMFSMDVIDTDLFLDMPVSSQNLYFHLALRADDDGFVSAPKRIIKTVNGSDDDMRVLIGKGFIIVFDTGVCVISHWRIHNYIQNDRHKKTIYKDEYNSLEAGENGEYRQCIQNVSKVDTQVRLGKVRLELGKVNNIMSDKSDSTPKYHDEIKTVIDHLNTSCQTKYRPDSKTTASHIRARLAEGYTVDDCKQVIDTKAADWLHDPKMSQYLRPQTLFAPGHFESYLNQPRPRPEPERDEDEEDLRAEGLKVNLMQYMGKGIPEGFEDGK